MGLTIPCSSCLLCLVIFSVLSKESEASPLEGRSPWRSDDGNDICECVRWTLYTKLLYNEVSTSSAGLL